MNKKIFEKAKWFIKQNKVHFIAESPYSLRFTVEGTEIYDVEFKLQNYEMLKLCSCKFGSLKNTSGNKDCSHILAAQTYLINRLNGELSNSDKIIENDNE
jgi:hypothetical protein